MPQLALTWKNFTAAPHRVMFLGGALQTVAVMVWWLFEMVTRYGIAGQPATWSILPNAAHLYLMVFGLFPSFIFGFIMTTFPRWMGGKEIQAHFYVSAFALLLLGNVLFYAGLFTQQTVVMFGVAATLAGWAVGIYALLRVVLDTPPSDKTNPIVILLALCLGWLSLLAYFIWLAGGNMQWLRVATEAGLWWFLLPLFVSVGHRMIPFFTVSALPGLQVARPDWPWWVILAGSALHGVLQLAHATAWLWLSDAAISIAAFYLSYCWGFRHSFKNPLLAILHTGFAWIGIAMLLSTIQSATQFLSHDTLFIWGLAPLHALTIGCYGSLVIGMGTRVTLGHSGLPFVVDSALKLMFIGMQAAAILRVLADILPLQHNSGFYLASALLWLACFAPWVWRYLPAYWRVRADGKPG
ncbi:MAG: NnrS family protein [Gallionellaceae bacterium]|jgi:uncharacterized protein involved in response to NO